MLNKCGWISEISEVSTVETTGIKSRVLILGKGMVPVVPRIDRKLDVIYKEIEGEFEGNVSM